MLPLPWLALPCLAWRRIKIYCTLPSAASPPLPHVLLVQIAVSLCIIPHTAYPIVTRPPASLLPILVQVLLVQIAVPSRTDVPEYQRLRRCAVPSVFAKEPSVGVLLSGRGFLSRDLRLGV